MHIAIWQARTRYLSIFEENSFGNIGTWFRCSYIRKENDWTYVGKWNLKGLEKIILMPKNNKIIEVFSLEEKSKNKVT